MPTRSNLAPRPERWNAVSIGLHWLTFALVVGLAIVGLVMTELPNGVAKIQVYGWHKSFGLTVLGLTLLRLAWRLGTASPTPVAGTPTWQRAAATTTHAALYILLLAVPVSGWLFNSAAGFPMRWFGVVALPKLGGFDLARKALAREAHETLFYLMAALLAVHAGAALWHHYGRGDTTLIRMLPTFRLLHRKP